MAAQGFNQAVLAKFFAVRAKSFGDSIRVKSECVAGEELAFFDFAFPFLESAENRRGGREAIKGIIGAKKQCGKMPAVDVAKAASRVVILGEEERGKGAAGSVLAEELIDGTEESLRLI